MPETVRHRSVTSRVRGDLTSSDITSTQHSSIPFTFIRPTCVISDDSNAFLTLVPEATNHYKHLFFFFFLETLQDVLIVWALRCFGGDSK